MKTVHLPAQTVPVLAETDVLVVGSGPGGLAAAISAARAGVDTMLVERYGCFGGNLTHVGVEGIGWYRRPETVDVEGVGREFEARAKAHQASYEEPQSISQGIQSELFKMLADNWVQEEGIRPLLHATAVDVLREGNTLTGLVVQSKSGRHAILAKRIVDATGDADIATLAGAPVRKTPKEEMYEEGCFHVPDGPGLGVELDADRLEHYQWSEAKQAQHQRHLEEIRTRHLDALNWRRERTGWFR